MDGGFGTSKVAYRSPKCSWVVCRCNGAMAPVCRCGRESGGLKVNLVTDAYKCLSVSTANSKTKNDARCEINRTN